MKQKQLLVIAGLDPCGGAGILADARVAAEHGVRVVGVITATTTQDTTGVHGVQPVVAVEEQLERLLADVHIDAVKIGMLADHAPAVARSLASTSAPVVWDPVLRSSRGDAVLTSGALDALVARATLITPNLDEAAHFAGVKKLLIKGGHRPGAPIDVLHLGDDVIEFPGDRIDAGPTHGTGCVLSTAIACRLALGASMRDAIAGAKAYLEGKLREPLAVGRGARCLV